MVQPALEMHSHRIFRAALLAVVGAWDPITVEANCLWLYSFGVTVVVLLSFHIGRTYSGDIRRSVWPCAASVLPMWCAPQHASIATMQVGAEKATTVSRRMRRRSMVEDMKVRNLSPATQLSNIHAVSKSALILTDRRITSALKTSERSRSISSRTEYLERIQLSERWRSLNASIVGACSKVNNRSIG